MPLIHQPVREFRGKRYTRAKLQQADSDELKTFYNLVWDNLANEYDEMTLKRRRKWDSHEEAVAETWNILGIYIGDIKMAKETAETPKAEKPTPACYSAEVVKRPSRKMFKRIKKVGEPDKSQRPFAWDSFKNGQRLIDIKEDPNLHAGKISFWMRQKPALIELEDISDEVFAKELTAWYKKHGLTDPTAAKVEKAKEREKAKAEREKERAAKAKEREKAKAEREKATAAKKAAADKAKAEKAKAAAEKKDAAAKKKAAAAAAKPKRQPSAPGKPAPAAKAG